MLYIRIYKKQSGVNIDGYLLKLMYVKILDYMHMFSFLVYIPENQCIFSKLVGRLFISNVLKRIKITISKAP